MGELKVDGKLHARLYMYPVPGEVQVSKELERASGVDMILYSHAPRP